MIEGGHTDSLMAKRTATGIWTDGWTIRDGCWLDASVCIGECRWAMEQNVTLSRFLNLLVSFSYP